MNIKKKKSKSIRLLASKNKHTKKQTQIHKHRHKHYVSHNKVNKPHIAHKQPIKELYKVLSKQTNNTRTSIMRNTETQANNIQPELTHLGNLDNLDNPKPTMCAPFITPLTLSKTKYLTQSNVNVIKSATSESCFTIEALRKIADKWNTTHPDMSIEYNDMTTGKYLWSAINNVMKAQCNNEVCWIKQDFIKNSSLYNQLLKNFKPIMPDVWKEKPTEWLDTYNIQNVMTQYEKKFPNYEFIGPVPMDFDKKVEFGQCVVDELCKINLRKLLDNGKNNIGIVFNLDDHDQGGSHWVALHCSINDGAIYYWDSYAMKPDKEVVILMKRLKTQGAQIGHNLKIRINNQRHQYKTSECGMYCIYFLTSLLEGKTFNNIIKNIVDDDTMNSKRLQFFNNI